MMRTIQMTIDERLLAKVDELAQIEGINRSAFMRAALEQAVKRYKIARMEEQDAAGYARYPIQPGEFDVWEAEQTWDDDWNWSEA